VDFAAGQQLQHYRLVEKIGEGGMGVVWKAVDTRLHREVALKFVPPESARDAQAVDRHLREARAASALNHPNICSIHDIGEQDGRRFIVMELLEGQSLQERLGAGAFDVDQAVDLAIQIADALDAAHQKGIVHRDVKPANTYITDRGQAKMLDFGLAKLAAPEMTPDTATRTALDLTAPGAVVGTVYYMSPEQAQGKELDARTDLFSFGVVLYEMITGRRAFDGETPATVFDAILNRAPAPPATLNAAVPEALERIVNRALEKDPALRYQSAADLCADLRRLQRSRLSTSTPAVAAGATARGFRTASVVVAIFVVALSAFALWRSMTTDEPAAPPEAAVADDAGPSIAVLRFENASDDPSQDYFSDGLTENIITELARYRGLRVVAESPTRTAEAGAELGTRYVLQGTVRTAGSRVRVTVQMSDSRDGRAVWSENYLRDRTADDLFALQDDLTQHVVNAIMGSYGALTRAELPDARTKQAGSLESFDCGLRAQYYLHVHTDEMHREARDCFERIQDKTANDGSALAWLGYLYAEEYHHRRNERLGEYDAIERAYEMTREAVRIDPSNHVAHGAFALTLFFRGDIERGKAEAYRAIELNPNNATWLLLLGIYMAQHEDFETGLGWTRRSVELDPVPPPWISMTPFYDHYHHGRYDEALVEAKKMEIEGDFREPLFIAAVYGRLGRTEEAAPYVATTRTRWGRPLSDLRRELIERHSMSPGLTDRILDGAAMAGLDLE
jgi:TolB-like protein